MACALRRYGVTDSGTAYHTLPSHRQCISRSGFLVFDFIVILKRYSDKSPNPMKPWLTVFCLLMMASMATAYDSILINQNRINVHITEFADYQQIDNSNRTIQQITQPEISRQFSPIHSRNLQYNQIDRGAWVTFSIDNPIGRSINLYIVIDVPVIASADLFYDLYSPSGYRQITTGTNTPYGKRPYQMGNLVLPMNLIPGEQQIYLKLDAIEPINMDIRLVDEYTLLQESRSRILFSAFWYSILVTCLIATGIAYALHRMPIALWSGTLIIGLALNLSGWTGSIAWWLTMLSAVEVKAINAGAYLTLAATAYLLRQLRKESSKRWLDDALIWLGRLFIALALVVLLPISNTLLSAQVVLIPIAMTILAIFWFEQRPETLAEHITVAGLASVLLYFSLTSLLMIGLISLYPHLIAVLKLLTLIGCGCFVWATWVVSRAKCTRMTAEGMNPPKVHWPLIRKLNHELRGPINGVLGMTELLQDTTLSAHQQEFVNTIQTAGFSLLREADQLQNLIRIGLNRLPDTEDEFDLYDLIEDTVQPFSRIAHSKQLELVLDIAPEIPTRYKGNAHIIEQILANLIDNALKYTEHGEVLLQVKPWQHGRVRFSITDTGPGIPKDVRSSLFLFPDTNNDNLQPKEVHLGLPICKYLVSLIGGNLSLSSELRMGTTFWVDLPLATAHSQNHVMPQSILALEDLRIMVVDDNLTCRKVIEHLALSWGAEVLSMSNGQSAMANLHNQYHKGEPVDVLILDQKMPTMSGTEMAQRIRQDDELNKEIVILMMTGSDDVSGDLEQTDTGIEFVMSKPVSARTLKETLKQAAPSIAENRTKNNAKNYFSY
jgi:two-component system, sensor histidine kinase RetS